MVGHGCGPRGWRAEAGGSQVRSHPSEEWEGLRAVDQTLSFSVDPSEL